MGGDGADVGGGWHVRGEHRCALAEDSGANSDKLHVWTVYMYHLPCSVTVYVSKKLEIQGPGASHCSLPMLPTSQPVYSSLQSVCTSLQITLEHRYSTGVSKTYLDKYVVCFRNCDAHSSMDYSTLPRKKG